MSAQDLINALSNAFGYTEDNNRDLIADVSFNFADILEELEVQHAYNVLVAYTHRNMDMIESNLRS